MADAISAVAGSSPVDTADRSSTAACSKETGEQPSGSITPDSFTVGAQSIDTLREAAAATSNVAKGFAADAALPQTYRFKPVTPDLARGKTTNALFVDSTAGRKRAATGRPAGEWVLRSDAPHSGAPTYHVNSNPRVTGVRDPHTPIPEGTYRSIGTAARVLEGVDKIAMPVAIGIDAARLGAAFHEDGNRIGTKTEQTAGSVAGGWAGAVAGAAGGAEGGAWIGGGIGAFFGGVGAAPGAAVGGVIGGIAGGIAGAIGGSWFGGKAVDVVAGH